MRRIIHKIHILSAIFLFSTQLIQAQWVQTKGPTGGNIYNVAISDSIMVARLDKYGGEIFVSKNNGESWTEINSSFKNLLNSIAVMGNHIFAATSGGVFLFDETQNGWTDINTGLPDLEVSSLAVQDSTLYAGTASGVFISINKGTSWIAANAGIENTTITSLAVKDNIIFAISNECLEWVCDQNLFLSGDNGNTWTMINGFKDTTVTSIAVSDSGLFIGANGIVFRSTDNGTSWIAIESIGSSISFVVNGKNIFAGTRYNGIFLSGDNGANWAALDSRPESNDVFALAANKKMIIAGTSNGVYRLKNNDSIWVPISSGIVKSDVRCLHITDNTILAGTTFGVFQSTDNGTTWTTSDLTNIWVQCFTDHSNTLFAGTSFGGIYRSVNNGIHWTAVNSGLTDKDVHSLAVCGGNIFAGTANGGIFRSTDNGTSWTAVNSGLPTDINDYYQEISSLAVSDNNIFAGVFSGVFLSADNGMNWNAVNSGLNSYSVSARSLAVIDDMIFAGTGKGVFHTLNNGASWERTGLYTAFVFSLAAQSNELFVYTNNGAGNQGVSLFDVSTKSWSAVNQGLPETYSWSLAVSDSNIFCGNSEQGVWRRPLSEMPEATNIKPTESITDYLNIKLYSPTRTNATARIVFNLRKSERVIVTIYNLKGHKIAIPANKIFGPGTNSINWNTSNMPMGCYAIRLQSSQTNVKKRLLITR